MFLAVRTGAFRWLRLALAALALVTSEASVARAAFGATCEAPGDASSDAPAPAAVVADCASSAAILPAIVEVPGAVTAWDAAAASLAPHMRPSSPAPPPPFRPPRAR